MIFYQPVMIKEAIKLNEYKCLKMALKYKTLSHERVLYSLTIKKLMRFVELAGKQPLPILL